MYVTSTTDIDDIIRQIKVIERELRYNRKLTEADRIMYHDELDYLRSFLSDEDT